MDGKALRFLFCVFGLVMIGACGEGPNSSVEIQEVLGDSLDPSYSIACEGCGFATIVLPVDAAIKVTLLERNAARWHALSVINPQDSLLAGPGVLLPGPEFDLGPYSAGLVQFRLAVYSNDPPHDSLGLAADSVVGEYPNWTIYFEDSGDADFDDIIIGIETFPDELELRCTPDTVQRAREQTSCVPWGPLGSSIAVSEWRFIGGAANEFQVVVDSAAPSSWDGPLVAGGVVTVHALLDGVPDSANSTVTVTPRPWSGPNLPTPIEEVTAPDTLYHLPAVPDTLHDLGESHVYASLETSPGHVRPVVSGPNYLLVYNDSLPGLELGAYFEVNHSALTDTTNAFYLRHPKGGKPGGTCRRKDLETVVLDSVYAHEEAHGDFATNWFAQPGHSLLAAVEGIVIQAPSPQSGTIDDVLDSTVVVMQSLLIAQSDSNKLAVDSTAGPLFPCSLLF